MKFFRCETCGNLVALIEESGVPMVCCGNKMTELIPGTTDGAAEKHLPVFRTDGTGVTVEVGSTAHPMTEVHFIEWIALETANGLQLKKLTPEEKPYAEFSLTVGESVKAVYAYCNIHGLWKTE